jgi:Leucine-rich repeat (LRR) protein
MEWWSSGCEGSGSDEAEGEEEVRVALRSGIDLEAKTNANLRTLRRLDLSGSSLAEVPSPLENCPRLLALSLRSNRLQELPKWLPKLQALRHLNLAGNRLQHFPSQILELTNLRLAFYLM